MKKTFSKIAFIAFLSASANAEEKTVLNTVKVVASEEKSQSEITNNNFHGAATYVSEEEIEKKQTSDIHRLLKDVPGLTIQEEDGYGLRPNIGIRGSRNERSADISLMEDGVLIAPAPYSASSAYYFPAIGRLQGVEVFKGTSAIKYGPRTTSGALNLITRQIPDKAKGAATLSYGSYNEKNANLNFGNSYDHFGYLLNFDHKSSDGFKKIDGGGNSGFEVNDFMTKFRFNTDKDADIYQELNFKLAYNDHNSNETYTGLTMGDFNSDPYRRYKSTALDNFASEHSQFEVSHKAEFSKDFSLTTTGYYHKFDRQWYRLNRVNDGVGGYKSISSIFDDELSSYLDVIKGSSGLDANHELEFSSNKRSYVSQGVQIIANSKIELGSSFHDLKYGLRAHDDFEDRFQRVDEYQFVDGSLSLTNRGIDGYSASNNRILKTRAYSAFLEDEISLGKWLIVPGIRYEHIQNERKSYAAGDTGRNNPTTTQNTQDVIIPGVSTSYSFTDDFSLFAGVHKGFGPASPGVDAKPETSINYETGFRLKGENKSFLETAFFLNDYDNLIVADSNGDQFNGGKVRSRGVEVASGITLKKDLFGKSLAFPLKAIYTFNDSEVRSSTVVESDEWGELEKGDKLAYVSPHQFTLSAGIEFDKISFNLSGRYVDAMRTVAGKGKIEKSEKIPSHFVADAVLFYQLKKDIQIFTAVDNILNREYAVAARPNSGLRPGKPMTVKVGVKIGF